MNPRHHVFLSILLLVLLSGILNPSPARSEEPALLEELLPRMERMVAKVRERPLISERHTPWEIMHAVIANEKEVEVFDSAAQEKVGGIDYLCQRARYEDKPIFRVADARPALPTRGLSYGLRESFQVQDHVDQFLMAFADAGVSLDQKIAAEDGKSFTVRDMLAASQATFQPRQELGWTLVATSTYLTFDDTWKTDRGEEVRIEDILALAIKRDPRRETEGGPHHLYGVAFALNRYRETDAESPLDGTWADARRYLDEYAALAKKYQRPDGSFSASMFRGSRQADSPRQMVWATGHTLEWLSVALSAEQLREPWVVRGVAALLDVMEKNSQDEFSAGGLYHAAHALKRYREKVAPKPNLGND